MRTGARSESNDQLVASQYRDSMGEPFDIVLDGERLGRQLDAVRRWMLTHEWQTLAEIAVGTGYGEAAAASISARLRDLRKPRFGGYAVEKRRRTAGTWEYRIATGSEPVSPERAS
jgi:hypothetical protein